MTNSLKLVLLVGAFGATLAVPANAQDDRYAGGGYGYRQGPEEVIVQAPRWHQPQRSTIGAPIRDVSLSEPVRFDDLDLRSDHDVRRLEARVRERAGTLCRRLDVRYPVTVSTSSRNCFREAMADAMDQVDAAVAQQRGYDDTDY
jgi:UrcA family protein